MGEYQNAFYIEILNIKFVLPLSHMLKGDIFSKIIAVNPAIQTEVKTKVMFSILYCFLNLASSADIYLFNVEDSDILDWAWL